MAPRYTSLIADDEAQVRLLVHVTIASDAYLVLEAGDGDEAWEILQTCRPDVVLLDVQMPGRDGFALTRAIRADPLLAQTPVILLTGAGTPENVAVGHDAGADHYLTKPFSPLHLLATLASCVGERPESAGWPVAVAPVATSSTASSTVPHRAQPAGSVPLVTARGASTAQGSAHCERTVSITT